MVNQYNYFDLWDLLVNELIGDLWLFILLGNILITYFCLRKQVGWQPTIVLNLLWWMIVFSEATGALLVLWTFVILLVGLLFYFIMSRVFRRG